MEYIITITKTDSKYEVREVVATKVTTNPNEVKDIKVSEGYEIHIDQI